MKGRYKLYLKDVSYVEDESWKTAKRYQSRVELEMGLGSLPETRKGDARGGIQTPAWAIALASPLIAISFLACFAGWLLFSAWKGVTTSLLEAGKSVWNLIRLFEQWRYKKAESKKENKDANL